MIGYFFLVYFLSFIFVKKIYAFDYNIETKIKELEKKLFLIQNSIETKEKKFEKIKKIYINTAIKAKLMEKQIYKIADFNKYKIVKEKFYLNKILFLYTKKEIESQKIELLNLKKEYSSKINLLKHEKFLYSETLKKGYYQESTNLKQNITNLDKIVDPITKEFISPGKYNVKVEPGKNIYSPQEGIIKRIQYISDNFAITIENQRCSTYIYGIGILKINLGDHVKAGQILGEAGFSQDKFNLFYDIECKN